jgi:homoserine kinase type II
MLNYLEGKAPDLTSLSQAAQYGRVVGEISLALANYATVHSGVYRGKSFTDMYGFHPLADRQGVQAFFECPPFPIPEELYRYYQRMSALVERDLPGLAQLPTQLVHHDLLAFNLLARGSRIRGILDFDFVSYDAGSMELAICLNHILQLSSGSFEMAGAFLQGYFTYMKCSQLEFDSLQLLTQVYHLTILHFYIGQHYSGKSIERYFLYILSQFAARNQWLNEHRLSLQRMLRGE